MRVGRITGLVAVVLLVALGWSTARYLLSAPEAREAAAGLRTDSVWVAPGAEDVLDEQRVRQVLGDRPIVVAVLAESYTGDSLDACDDVAARQPRTIVLLYLASERTEYPTICATRRFPEPAVTEGSDALGTSAVDQWLFRLGIVAERSARYRVDDETVDRTPEVEELVLAFDALAVEEYPDGVPTRDAGAAPLTWATVLLQLAGMVVGLVALHLLLRRLAQRYGERLQARQLERARRAEVEQRLSQAASSLVLAGPAPGVAEAAEGYLAALAAFERDEVEQADRELVAVRQSLGLEPAPPRRRRRRGRR